ncbi:DUF4468 domain-containing protein [Rurimicrobium arvi]
MKRIAALLMILCSSVTLSYAKTKLAPASLQLKDAEWSFEKVIEVPNTPQKDIYESMKTWVLSHVPTADKNTQFDDANQAQIITYVSLPLGNLWTFYTDVTLSFKFTIQVKDNKARFSAGAFNYSAIGTSSNLGIKNSPLETYEDEKGMVKKINQKIDESFPAFIAKAEKGLAKQKSDW